MAIIATDSTRFSGVVKREYDPASAYCRDTLVYNGAAVQINVGAVLGAFVASPTATPGAMVGTGNATAGTASAVSATYLQVGTYTVSMLTATTFVVLDPQGDAIGTGATGVAFKANGLTFTVTAGGTAAAAGDTLPIVVGGTVKYKLVEASATDGSQVAKAVYLADQIGLAHPITPVLNTDTQILAMTRGPVIVAKGALQFGASVNSAPLLAAAYAQLTAVGILPETTI